MTDLLQKIEIQLQTGYPFAVYAKPGSTIVTGIFQNTQAPYHLIDYSAKGFAFAPFAGREGCFIPYDKSDVLSVEFKPADLALAEINQPEIDSIAKMAFEKLVAESVAAIQEGQFEKLVLSRKETVQIGEGNIIDIYQKLLAAYPMAFRYCFYHLDSGLWMGATPEQLLKVENTTLHTVALAGTQVYREGETAVWETKEKEEQQFVTDYIMASLAGFTSDIQRTEPYTFRAGNIVHIKTDISAELKSKDSLKEVVQVLHPTPAVCGLPKNEAKTFLIQNEGYDRAFYAGFLGEMNADFSTGQPKTDLFVNLRCMKVEDSTANIYIGCGITKDSNPEKEFIETVNKSMTMRKVLQPASK